MDATAEKTQQINALDKILSPVRDSLSVNGPRTYPISDAPLTQSGSRFDLATVRKQLNALRAKHGAQSEIGWRCSNLIEQLKNYPDLPADRKPVMEKFIADSVARLSALIKNDT